MRAINSFVYCTKTVIFTVIC